MSKKSVKKKTNVIDNEIATILSKVKNNSLSTEEINYLTHLTIFNYDTEMPLLMKKTATQKEFLLNMMNFLQVNGFENTKLMLDEHSDLLSDKTQSARLKMRYIISSQMTDERATLYIEINNYKNPITISEGAVDCIRCGSKETLTTQKQTRSGDEPVTITNVCTVCKYNWKD